MNCSEWRLEISAYIDASLDPGDSAAVEQHLRECADCASFFAEQRELKEILQAALPVLDPPAQIWQNIESRLVSRSSIPSAPKAWNFRDLFRMPRLSYAGAAFVFVLMLGLFVFDTPETVPEEERFLAELEAFSINVEGNPFLSDMQAENPFFKLSQYEPGNPFKGLGGSQQ